MLFQTILAIHIVSGFLALLLGAMAIASRKGGKYHLQSGKWYVLNMYIVGISAIVMTQLKSNPFLFTVGVFTLYLTYVGQRSIFYYRLKQTYQTNWKDIVPSVIALAVSLGMVGQPIFQMVKTESFTISVMAVFGSILLGFVIGDLRMLVINPTFQANDKSWLIKHISMIGGAYIATLTAFLVTNVNFSPAWVIWLAPTLIGSILLARTSKEWRNKLKINS